MVTEQPYPPHRDGHDDDPSDGRWACCDASAAPFEEGAGGSEGIAGAEPGRAGESGPPAEASPAESGSVSECGPAIESNSDATAGPAPVAQTEWLRLGRARPVPFAVFDGQSGEPLTGRALRAAWNEACAAERPPAPEPVDERVVPALPEELLTAMGWRVVAAPRWDDDEDAIRAWLGPAPTEQEARELADCFGWDDSHDGRTQEFDDAWVGAARFTESGSSGADRLAHADPDPAPRGWARPARSHSGGEGLPVGVAPRLDGEQADVGAHARRRADWQALYDLENLDVPATDPYTLVEAVAAWNRQEALAAYHQRMLAFELANRPQDLGGPSRFEAAAQNTNPVAAAEVAFRLGITRQRARRLIDAGTAMARGSGILVGVALQQGEIDAPKADLIIERTAHLPMELALDVHDQVLGSARLRTYPQVERDLARAIAEADPEDFSARHARARTGRRVSAPRTLPDGMASMRFVGSATDAMALHTALEAAARSAKAHGDKRTLDQLRADALATMGHTALATGRIGPCSTCEDPGKGPSIDQDHRADADTDADVGAGADTQAGAETDTRAKAGTDAAPDATADAGAGRDTDTQSEAGPGARARTNTDTDTSADARAADSGEAEASAGAPAQADPEEDDPDGTRSDPTDIPAEQHLFPGDVLTPFTLGTVGGARAQIRITVPLSTLMGTSIDAADLEGYGPIPAEVARAWAAGGTWKRLVTDPLTDRALEVTATRYEPPDWLREQVIANEPFCTAPGCNTQARHSDVDHGVPFPEGPTAEWNLHPVCRHHHQLKTDRHLVYTSPGPGVHEWTTPTGHRYRTDPEGTHLLSPRGQDGLHESPATSGAPNLAHHSEDDPPPF